MRKILIFFLMNIPIVYFCQSYIVDSFSDGDFTNSPVWTGDTGNWAIVTSAASGPNASGSYTLRLNVTSGSGTQYISTQINSMASINGHTWSFWIGKRSGVVYSSSNNIEIWLYANESNLESSTVDGYAILIGDDSGDDEIKLCKMIDGTISSTVITSTTSLQNGLEDIGFMLRITRSSLGEWNLYSSTLPVANGTGASASDIPSAANTPNNIGSNTDNTLVINDNNYIGLVAIHSSGSAALTGIEYDQIYFDLNENSPLPVELTSFTANVSKNKVDLNWTTATEINNYGFEILRSDCKNAWQKIGFVNGFGNCNSEKNYSFIDQPLGGKEFKYKLRQIDFDGTYDFSSEIIVMLDEINKFQLEQNYPNPFNPFTTISYQLPVSGQVTLTVYDLLGRKVEELVNDFQESGFYAINFNGINLPSGTYFYKLDCGTFSETKKFILMK